MSEIWKEISGYGDKYSVSNYGNVKNHITGRLLNPFDRRAKSTSGKKGYKTVHLTGGLTRIKNASVHSLIMAAFIGDRPDGYVINHIDGNPSNNHLSNLEYCTQSHNRKQDFIHGRQSLKGENNTQSKIKQSDVLVIVSLRNGGMTYKQIGELFGLTISGVSSIFNGYTWSHITHIKPKNEPLQPIV